MAIKAFTQDMIDNLKGVAQKFGGMENPNFQSVVNSKYGAGAIDSLTSAGVTPTQQAGLTGINSPSRNTPPVAPVAPLTGAGAVGTPPPVVQAPDTDVPVVPTSPEDIAWNKKQAEFNKSNPVGTAVENIQYTPEVAPTPVAKTTTTPVKAVEPVSPDVRTAEINANLAEGLKNDAGIQKAVQSGDIATFRARYGYDTADQNKKQLLDSFFQSYQPTGNEDYYTMMRSGQRIENPASLRSPEYKQAVARFNQFKKFANYDVNALASALKGGMLIEGTKVYEDLSNDPNAKMKLDQAKVFNNASGKGTDYNAVGTNATSEILKDNVNTAKMFDDGVISEEEYKAALETQEITAQRKDLQADKIKYDTLKAQYDNIETDVENEMKGKDVTSSFMNALIADRRKGMYKDLQIATDTYNTKLGTLTDMTKTQAGLFETNLGLYKERKQQDNARSMIDYQAETGLKANQAQFEQKMEQQAQMASDPAMATQAVLDTYAKLGILPERSAQEIIQSVQNDIAGGMTLGQSLSNLNRGFQSKDQYKAIINPIAKTTTSSPSWKQDKSGNWYDSNSTTKPGGVSNWISSMGDGKVTFYGGRVPGDVGLDIAGKEGFEVSSPVDGKVLKGGFDKNYGNYLEIMANDGSRVRLSHLDPNVVFQPGTQISAGQVLGNQKNTGTVIAGAGRGVLDITTWGADGKARSGKDTEAYITGTGGQTGGEVMGSAGVPLSYQRRIEQMVPVQLRNSDAESKKLLADIKNMSDAGLSPEDATLTYLGFNVTDANKKAEAMKMVSQARGLGEDLPEDFFIKLSDYVNNGNIAGAKSFTDRIVEGTIKKQVGEDFVSTPNLKFAESTLARLNSMIERNKDKIGPLSGRFADLEKQLKNDPDYQALKTLLQGSLADTRRAFGGTAVSQSELEALKDFVGADTKMPIQNLQSLLNTNFTTLQDKYGQQRSFYLGEEPTSAPMITEPMGTAPVTVPDDFLSIYNSIK